MTATTDGVCRVCDQRHTYTPRDGWYSTANGQPRHPYTPRKEGDAMTVHIGNTVDTDGFHSALFGALYACDFCGAIADRPDLELHRGACHPRDAA